MGSVGAGAGAGADARMGENFLGCPKGNSQDSEGGVGEKEWVCLLAGRTSCSFTSVLTATHRLRQNIFFLFMKKIAQQLMQCGSSLSPPSTCLSSSSW